MNSQIVYLDVRSLTAHPDNPRKDLGDLKELAESIWQNGVLQNLTVVKDDTNINVLGTEHQYYRIVIGHRRAAAAKLAGVETVPCIISTMSPREQVETMLMENMQRSDLTVLEQAHGFQMMLDFGSSIDEVAQRTGFSPSTVRRRVKLMELDQKHLEKAVARGGSLMDYMELDKIEDAELRDKVLCSIGTENFKATLMSALRAEKSKARMIDWEADVATFAEKIEKRNFIGEEAFPMDYIRNYAEWNTKDDTIEVPADADKVRYFYVVGRDQIDLYSEHIERANSADEARKVADDEFRKIKAQLSGISDGHYELRMGFVRNFSGAKKHMPEISKLVGIAIIGDGKYHGNEPISPYALEHLFGLQIEDDIPYSELYVLLEDFFKDKPEHTMFALAYAALDKQRGYFTNIWNKDMVRFQCVHEENTQLDMLYYFLNLIGYEMSDEEREMQYGTHPLLEKVEESEQSEPSRAIDDIEDYDDDDEDEGDADA